MNCKAIHFLLLVLFNAALAAALSSTASAYNAAHFELLKAGVESWNNMRAAHKEFIPDLSDTSLKGKKLRGADLQNANLSGADLSQSDLSNANLQNALLDSAKMSYSILFKANLEGALLTEANLESAQLGSANLHRAVLEAAVLKKADCSNTDFSESNLRKCNLRETTLVNANLTGSDLRGAYLWRANLSRAKITAVTVSESTVLDSRNYASPLWAENHQSFFIEEPVPAISSNQVSSTSTKEKESTIVPPQQPDTDQLTQQVNTMQKTDVPGSNKSSASRNSRQESVGPVTITWNRRQYEQLKSNVFDWNNMRKRNRDISVNLNGASFDRKNLAYADLSHASLRDASFKGTDLGDSNLRSSDLRGCNFREANLQHADLGSANLRGANLWRANLSRTRLTDAVVSRSTILDSGQKATQELAARRGLIFVEQ
jgi:uncharacterized protein YjbI with pentapeptide repeats